MGVRKISLSIAIFLNALLLLSLIFYNVNLNEELRKKHSAIQDLEREKAELGAEVEKVKSFLKNVSETRESELRNPAWEELKTFLELDDTNELIYDKGSFDCSGFAIELFKRTRANGLKSAIVEVNFEENETGHVLNAFRTTDEGLIFVDATGNEGGNGRDKIAYVEEGKTYGIIALEGLKERRVDCSVECAEFAKEITYATYADFFDYSYFSAFKKCKDFYEDCIDLYNKAVDEYNKGSRKYSSTELRKWFGNIEILEKELVSEKYYLVSEMGAVENIQIYW